MFSLRPYQQELVDKIYEGWGRVRVPLVVLPTGAGKTVVFSSIIRDHKGASAAVVHRREIVGQISLSLAKLGVKHRVVAPPKTVQMIRKKHLRALGKSFVDPNALCGVVSVQTLTSKSAGKDAALQRWVKQVSLAVWDECFTAGTLIDGKPIERLQKGDTVTAFNEENGFFEKRKVVRVFKNPAPDLMVRVDLKGHHVLCCTLGHPFWTKRGWVEAGELKEDDEVLTYGKMFYVRKRSGFKWVPKTQIREDRAGVLQPSVQPGVPVPEVFGGNDENKQEIRVRHFCPDEGEQPNEARRSEAESLRLIETDRPRALRSRGERAPAYKSRGEAVRTIRGAGFLEPDNSENEMREGVRVPYPLQNRLRKRSSKNSDRSGRQQPPRSSEESAGREKRRVSMWKRLGSVQVLKREDIARQSGGVFDGYVYNIEVDGLHTYVANGVTVHNCHHYVATGTWARAVEMMSGAKMLMVTATPERADGLGLGAHADGYAEELIEGPTTAWLIEQGFLSSFKYIAPESDFDVSGLAVTASGDFNARAFRGRVIESHLVGDVVQHYRRFTPGKRAIVFATDVQTAHEMADAFVAAGVPAVALSGNTDAAERDRELEKFECGQTQVLLNVGLFDEGFDVPAVEVVILACPTLSLAKYLQTVGRGLRIMEGKEGAVIIDLVRNWERHGMPNWPRVWTLDRREKSTKSKSDTVPQKVCTGCSQVYEAFYKSCPFCGETPKPAERSAPAKVEGDLFELDVEGMAALFAKMNKADMADDEYAEGQVTRNIPPIGRPADLRRHKDAKYRREVLRGLVKWWIGMAPPDRELSEMHRRFYYRFGIDIGTAFTLNAKDTDALIGRIQKRFHEDLI